MALTGTQREVYSHFDNNDFVPVATIEEFRKRLEQEGNVKTLSYALEKFVTGVCPNCNGAGAFKWHLLGKLTHPACGRSWYVGPGTYTVAQLKGVFRTGSEIGSDMASQAEKKGERGTAEAIFGFVLGAGFRLPFALLMVPIQAIISLGQKKPAQKS